MRWRKTSSSSEFWSDRIRGCLRSVSSSIQKVWARQPLAEWGGWAWRAGPTCLLPQEKSIALLCEWIVKTLVSEHEHFIRTAFWVFPSAAWLGVLWCTYEHRWLKEQRVRQRASPGASWGRLFSLTKDVRSEGWGKSCWSAFNSESTSCRAAHLMFVEEANFSSSVAWSSCVPRSSGSCSKRGNKIIKCLRFRVEWVGGNAERQLKKRKQLCEALNTHLGWVR